MALLPVCFGASSAPRLPDTGASHRIKLEPFVVPPTRTAGVVVRVRINGGPPLRLLLDSGAQYVVLDRKSAERSGCLGGANLELVGVGAAPATLVKSVRVDLLQVGDLALRDIPVLIADHTIAEGIQGVVPLALFDGFLIRLDVQGKKLDLLPYSVRPADADGAIPVVSSNRLLFVQGTANDSQKGYFMLDTGASYSAVSRTLVRQLKISESLARRVPLRGGTAELDAAVFTGLVRLRVGGRTLAMDPVVAVDLSTASRYHQMEISGLIGYPALRELVVTVNYRDGQIRIQ